MQHPWVGAHYGADDNLFGGKKILVVGESHYSDPEDIGKPQAEITRQVVRDYQAGGSGLGFFTKIITFLTGKSADDNGHAATRAAYDHLAFYNYIPVIVGSAPREFEWSLWSLGEPEYNQVLAELQPDLIVVLGRRLWNNAYHRHTNGAVLPGDTETALVHTNAGEVAIPTIKIPHPSWPGFSGPALHEHIRPHLA